MIGLLATTALFLGALALQWWWSAYLSLWGLAPQVLLVLTVAVAARSGPLRAMLLGFGWGLFLDLLAARLLGAGALTLTLVGYGTGSVRRQMDVVGLAPQCVVVVFMTWAGFLMHGLLGYAFLKAFLWPGWAVFLLTPFYNCLLTVLIHGLWGSRRDL